MTRDDYDLLTRCQIRLTTRPLLVHLPRGVRRSGDGHYRYRSAPQLARDIRAALDRGTVRIAAGGLVTIR